jgi:hypothetical protein
MLGWLEDRLCEVKGKDGMSREKNRFLLIKSQDWKTLALQTSKGAASNWTATLGPGSTKDETVQ